MGAPTGTTSYHHDAKFGVLLDTTDPNSATTTYAYDGFGRVTGIWAPLDAPMTQSGSPLYGTATVLVGYQVGGGQPYRVQIARRKDAGGGDFARRQFEWRFYDGIGRLIQTQTDFNRSLAPIRAQDVNDLLTALRNGAPFSPVHAGTSPITAKQFAQLRTAIQVAWNTPTPGLGAVPGWSSGVSPNGPSLNQNLPKTPIYGSDLVDLRQWFNFYESSTSSNPSNPSLTGWSNPAGGVRVVNRFYDGRNLLASESIPHLLNLNVPGLFARADWLGSPAATTYTYDALKRPLTR